MRFEYDLTARQPVTSQEHRWLERLNRHELARYLHQCPRHSRDWQQAMAVWQQRFARIDALQHYAAISILACAFLIALAGLMH